MATLDELLKALKDDHGIDVPALQAAAAEGSETQEVQAALTSALLGPLQEAGLIKLSGGENETLSVGDVAGAVAELAATNATLQGRVDTLELTNTKAEVQRLVDDGFIAPAQLDSFVELKLSNPDMFDRLVPAQPIIKMSAESGTTPPRDEAQQANIDAEITRLTAIN